MVKFLGYVYYDCDNDGVCDLGEEGFEGVELCVVVMNLLFS